MGKVEELLKVSFKFSELAAGPTEYPASPEELNPELRIAQNNNILDKNYNLNFYITDNKFREGDPGCGEIIFADSYDFDNEEYKGDYNMAVYSEIARDALYLACKITYDNWPTEIQAFYYDALGEELQYNTDDDAYGSFKFDWASKMSSTSRDGREEDRRDLLVLLNKYEEDIRTVLIHGFEL